MRSAIHTPIKKLPELLAPAGGVESACAALQYGADAIYLGMMRFSARASAENFTFDTLREIVGLAHSLSPRRKVYVTVNTLILQHEISEVVRLLASLERAEVDGVIVQDLGVYRLIKHHFPLLKLHASTQMTVHNLEGALMLAELGFSRVTLARELTFDEIKEITQKAGIETEIFIHGALCYSYSGLCLFSSHAYGRSGNRGKCAYCCRELYSGTSDDKSFLFRSYCFSMKDLALVDFIPQLINTGVSAFKIEGRMKSALYVSAVTDLYRKVIDGQLSLSQINKMKNDIRTIFSRPWTSLYFQKNDESPVDPEFVGHRGLCIGTVISVRKDKNSYWLCFQTERALEKHDGLQLDVHVGGRPYGFPVTTMRVRNSPQQHTYVYPVMVPAGTNVEVLLPPGHPVIPEGTNVYCSSSQAVKRSYKWQRLQKGKYKQRMGINVSATITPELLSITACLTSAPQISATFTVPGPFQPAVTPEKTPEAFKKAFERLKDTDWFVMDLNVDNKFKLFVSPAILNEARREIARILSEKYNDFIENRLQEIINSIQPATTLDTTSLRPASDEWSLKILNPSTISAFEVADFSAMSELIIALSLSMKEEATLTEIKKLVSLIPKEKIRIALPLIVRMRNRERLYSLIKQISRAGLSKWEVSNLAGFYFLKNALSIPDISTMDITADWSVLAMNTLAIDQLCELGVHQIVLSPEDCEQNISTLLQFQNIKLIVIVFQHTPLFISETTPVTGIDKAFPSHIKSHSGQIYSYHTIGTVKILTSERPFSLVKYLPALRKAGAFRFRVDLMWSDISPQESVNYWRKIINGSRIPETYDGNYKRGLL
jgi:putative protease